MIETHNILSVIIDENIHEDLHYILENKASFNEIKILCRLFFRINDITGDTLMRVYNSENRDYVTNIPLLQSFIKECNGEEEIEALIRTLTDNN
jgi:hypothetical protein